MEFNRVNNTEHPCSLGVSSISYMGMRKDPMCSLTETCVIALMGVLAFISIGFCMGAGPQGFPPFLLFRNLRLFFSFVWHIV